MSHLLELLGRGLDSGVAEVLQRYFRAPSCKGLDDLETLAAQQSDWPDVHFQLGLARLRESNLDEAIVSLSNACRLKPDFLGPRLALASAYAEKGDLASAVGHLKTALTNHPDNAEILFALGFCSEKLRQADRALDYYRDAIARNGEFAAARERLAAVAVMLGRNAEAIEQYETLLEANPQENWLHSALAHLYYRNGQYSRAVTEFETAIALEPDNWSLVDDEVESLVADGQLREAIERLHALLDKQGPFPDLHLRLADLYGRVGNDEAGMRHYHIARDLQPKYLEAAVKLGTHHMMFGRWVEAAEAFFEAAELNETLLVNYVGMGVAQWTGGLRNEAMKSFELASAVEPNSSLLLAEMARLQLKAAAADEYARAFAADAQTPPPSELENEHLLTRHTQRHGEEVARRPAHADLRYRYGVLLRAEGRLGEALEQFKAAVGTNPSYVKALIKLGITQQELGMSDEAVESFRRALELKPEFVDLHYRLGLLYTDRKEFEQAVRELEAASTGSLDNEQVRAGLALALQNMGLMDRAAAMWRSLSRMGRTTADKG